MSQEDGIQEFYLYNHSNHKIMATLTNEQIEQKKLLLAEKMNEMKSLYKELVEAGAIELSEEELDEISGGGLLDRIRPTLEDLFAKWGI